MSQIKKRGRGLRPNETNKRVPGTVPSARRGVLRRVLLNVETRFREHASDI